MIGSWRDLTDVEKYWLGAIVCGALLTALSFGVFLAVLAVLVGS